MHIQVIVLVTIAEFVLIDGRSTNGVWRKINLHDGLELLKKQPPHGFEYSSSIGNFALYLARLTFAYGHSWAGCAFFGKLFFRDNGELTYNFVWGGWDISNKIDNRHEHKVELLMTPLECLSWVPIKNNAGASDLPRRYLYETVCGKPRAICRAWVDKKKSLYIGWWSVTASTCWMSYDGSLQSVRTNVEILAFNDLGDALPDCQG